MFGPLCRRADGAFEALIQTRAGQARRGTFPRRAAALAPSRHLQTPLWSQDSTAVTVAR